MNYDSLSKLLLKGLDTRLGSIIAWNINTKGTVNYLKPYTFLFILFQFSESLNKELNVDSHMYSLPYRVVDPCTLSQFDSTCQGKSYMYSTSTLTSSPQPFNEFKQTMCKTNRGHAQK